MPDDDCLYIRLGDYFRRRREDASGTPAAEPDPDARTAEEEGEP
ncbi:hypothetical protein [Roseicella aerolata]|nr:hypothetical protein [Roseicella aerolata]